MTRLIKQRLCIDWDHDGDFTGPYEDASALLVAARGDMRLNTPESSITGGRGMVATMSLTLRNPDGLLSPLRKDGPLYDYLKDGGMYHAPCYLEVSIDNGVTYYRVFTGVLKLPNLSTLTTRQTPTLTVEARSLEEKLLQKRTSTSRAAFAAYHDDGYSEGQLIAAWLEDAGVDAGDMAIDAGLMSIPWAWLDDESLVEEIWTLASACGGRYYCDPDGTHRYENMAHWQLRTRSLEVQQRYTKDDFRQLQVAYDDKDLYNTVTVETAPRVLDAAAVVWSADDPVSVPAGATVTLTARFDAAVYMVQALTFAARTAGGLDATADVALSASYQAQRAELSITNAAGVMVYVYPIELFGQALAGGPTQEETVTAAANATFFAARGIARTRSVRGNPYIQERAHAATLAQYIQHRHEYPRETWRLTDCVGFPELRLGDRIEIADNDWLHKDGAAGAGVSLIGDDERIITANETIPDVGIVLTSTIDVEGEWIVEHGDVTTDTTISSPVTVPAGTTRTDTSGQYKTDGAVAINAGVEVTVAGEWAIIAEGVYALVTGVAWRLDSGGFHQDLEAIAANHLFRHDGEYFVLGTDLLAGGKVTFY